MQIVAREGYSVTDEKYGIPRYFGFMDCQTYEHAGAAGYRKQYFPAVIQLLEKLARLKSAARWNEASEWRRDGFCPKTDLKKREFKKGGSQWSTRRKKME